MPVTKSRSVFGRVSAYINTCMVAKKRVSSGDTSGGGGDAGVGDTGGGDAGGGCEDVSVSPVIEYSQAASVHGIKYVWDGNRSVYRRIVWAVFFFGMFCGLTAILIIQLKEMSSYPILTKQLVVMEAEVEFPAVTICNLNQFRKSFVQDNTFLRQFLARMSGFDDMFDPINFTDPIWNKANETVKVNAVAKLLDYAPHPLNDTLIGCRWKHKQYPCSELFTTVVTDFGVCYSFNTHETEKKQRTSDLFGNLYGLSIIMNTQQPEYVLSQWNVASGFRILLHGFYKTPQMIEEGFSVGPGSSYFGKISAKKMSFLPAPFKAFGDKECVDSTGQLDGYLRYYHTYDLGACFLECQMNFTSNACGCRGLYDRNHMALCNPRVYLECYLPKFTEFRETKTLRNSCECPMSCKMQAFDVSLSMASYPSQAFMENYNSLLSEEDYMNESYYRNNYLELHLYYDNSQTVSIEQFPQYTFESIMSSLGGQMGIFLGASIISLVEFLEFIVWAVTSKIMTARNKMQT